MLMITWTAVLRDELQLLASKHFARFSESQLESRIRLVSEQIIFAATWSIFNPNA